MYFTGWYRLRPALPWMQGPTRDGEGAAWEGLFARIGGLGGLAAWPDVWLEVLPLRRMPWEVDHVRRGGAAERGAEPLDTCG